MSGKEIMNQKRFLYGLLILLCVVIVGYFLLNQRENLPNSTTVSDSALTKNEELKKTHVSDALSLSSDKQSINVDNTVLLSIDNQAIFNWFKTKSQLCEKYFVSIDADRRLFCEDFTVFKSKTRFVSAIISPDRTKIAFTIETDIFNVPDNITLGIFYPLRTANTIHFFTDFSPGNEFISFSPDGINFVYRDACWEGTCGFNIKDSETLEDKTDFVPKEVDMRGDFGFVKWVSDNTIEYTLEGELKQASF